MGDRRHQNPFLPKNQASAPSSARFLIFFYGFLLNLILWHRGNPSGVQLLSTTECSPLRSPPSTFHNQRWNKSNLGNKCSCHQVNFISTL
jgi:hypothetical protein